MNNNPLKKLRKCLALNQPPIIYGGAYLFLIFLFAAIFYFYPMPMGISRSFTESLYFSISTITTLGYGDITPNTNVGKIMASVEALLGIALLGLFLNALSHKGDI